MARLLSRFQEQWNKLAETEAIQVGWLPSLTHAAVGPCCVRILLWWCIAETPVINHDTPAQVSTVNSRDVKFLYPTM
jgi:hypothetical protein